MLLSPTLLGRQIAIVAGKAYCRVIIIRPSPILSKTFFKMIVMTISELIVMTLTKKILISKSAGMGSAGGTCTSGVINV